MAKSPLNTNFINAFLNATIDVIDMMAEIAATPGRPYIKRNENAKGDISGIIGMAGAGLLGAFSINFRQACILAIVNSMLGESYQGLNDEVIDCVGEITNIISGSARAMLSERGVEYGMATPTVVCAKDHSVTQVTKVPVIVMPFTTEAGSFLVEISLWDTKKE